MKTLKFLKNFRQYKEGQIKTFKSDHKADSLLLVEGIAEEVETPKEEKEVEKYENKAITSKKTRSTKSKKKSTKKKSKK